MKTSYLKYFIVIITSVLMHSCTKNPIETNADPLSGLSKVAEGYAPGSSAKLVLYTKENQIYTGYTKFYIALYDSISGKQINNAQIQLTPIMKMGSMSHSSPYENPDSEKAINHLFPCSITFTMSSMGGSWSVRINILNSESGKAGEITLPLIVNEPNYSRQKSFTALHNGSKYFISLIEPSSPKIGINDVEIAVYKKASMMSWPADSSLSILMTPEMPSMGHGSPNNINPIHTGKGHYKGKANFTMSGLWRLNMDFMSGTSVADSTQYFDIEF